MTWRVRGEDQVRKDRFRRAVNCTGPQGDLSRSEEPLIRNLLASRQIQADALHLGINVDSQARLIGDDGVAQDRLRAIGPMTRGEYWEVIAIPDLRMQTWGLARRLANQHWIGGEGL